MPGLKSENKDSAEVVRHNYSGLRDRNRMAAAQSQQFLFGSVQKRFYGAERQPKHGTDIFIRLLLHHYAELVE